MWIQAIDFIEFSPKLLDKNKIKDNDCEGL